MSRIIRVLALRAVALLALAPLVLAAGSRTFSWQAPVQRSNGDTLPLSELDSYSLRCGTAAGGPYTLKVYSVPANGAASQQFQTGNDFAAGTYFCIATAIDTESRESLFSNEVTFIVGRCEVTDCTPKPPLLTVGQ